MCVILPLLNILVVEKNTKTAIWFISFNYRSSFKLTVTRLNNNNNMYPLPFFYLNWELGRLDAFFRQIKSFRRFHLAFGLGLQTFYLINFS